jgi:hypothetical protein
MMITIETKYEDFPLKLVAQPSSGNGSGLSCSTNIVSCPALFYLAGFTYKGKTYSTKAETGWGLSSLFSHCVPPAAFEVVPAEFLRNAVWEHIVKSWTQGATIFADRINRTSKMSPTNSYSSYALGGATCSTAAFAAWLLDRTDLGTLIPSPVFHNPVYAVAQGFSMCQIWTFFPKARMLYVPPKTPDLSSHTKENFLKEWGKKFGVDDPQNWMKETYI